MHPPEANSSFSFVHCIINTTKIRNALQLLFKANLIQACRSTGEMAFKCSTVEMTFKCLPVSFPCHILACVIG